MTGLREGDIVAIVGRIAGVDEANGIAEINFYKDTQYNADDVVPLQTAGLYLMEHGDPDYGVKLIDGMPGEWTIHSRLSPTVAVMHEVNSEADDENSFQIVQISRLRTQDKDLYRLVTGGELNTARNTEGFQPLINVVGAGASTGEKAPTPSPAPAAAPTPTPAPAPAATTTFPPVTPQTPRTAGQASDYPTDVAPRERTATAPTAPSGGNAGGASDEAAMMARLDQLQPQRPAGEQPSAPPAPRTMRPDKLPGAQSSIVRPASQSYDMSRDEGVTGVVSKARELHAGRPASTPAPTPAPAPAPAPASAPTPTPAPAPQPRGEVASSTMNLSQPTPENGGGVNLEGIADSSMEVGRSNNQ